MKGDSDWASRAFSTAKRAGSVLVRSAYRAGHFIKVAGRWFYNIARRLTEWIWKSCITWFAPIPVLTPWLLAGIAFIAICHSGQGEALVEHLIDRSPHFAEILLVCVVAIAISAAGGFLALLAVGAQRSDLQIPPRNHSTDLWTIAAGTWLAFASVLAPFALAVLTNSYVAIIAIACITVMMLMATLVLGMRIRLSSRVVRMFRATVRYRGALAILSLCLAMGTLAAGALIATYRPTTFMSIGSLATALVGLSANATVFGVLLIVVPQLLRRPGLAIIPLLLAICWAMYPAQRFEYANPLLKTESAAEAARNEGQGTAYCKMPENETEVLQAHGGRQQIALVSAEGGGIRAAYWTATRLSQLDAKHGGRLTEEIVSLSGVSGGSLGLATWLAASERSDLSFAGRHALIEHYLSSDFLAGMVGGLLFLDVPRLLLGPGWFGADRNQVFEKLIADRWKDVGATSFFARPISAVCLRSFGLPPLLVFNTTDVTTGKIVRITPAGLDPMDGGTVVPLSHTTLSGATVAQAIHLSARFPYLSSPAVIGLRPSVESVRATWGIGSTKEGEIPVYFDSEKERGPKFEAARHLDALLPWARTWTLVDGGYADNTGLTETTAVLTRLQELRQVGKNALSHPTALTDVRIKVLHLESDPMSACVPLKEGWSKALDRRMATYLAEVKRDVRCSVLLKQVERSLAYDPLTWLTAPLESLLSVRSRQSSEAVNKLSGSPEYVLIRKSVQLTLEWGDCPNNGTSDLPALGWTLSPRARSLLKCLETKDSTPDFE